MRAAEVGLFDDQHGDAFYVSVLQGPQGVRCFVHREGLHHGAQRRRWGQTEQFPGILHGVVGYGPQYPFTLQQFVLQFRDRAHVNACQHQGCTCAERLKDHGHKWPDRGEDHRSVKFVRAAILGSACPRCAQSQRQFTMMFAAGVNPHVQPLGNRYPSHEVG